MEACLGAESNRKRWWFKSYRALHPASISLRPLRPNLSQSKERRAKAARQGGPGVFVIGGGGDARRSQGAKSGPKLPWEGEGDDKVLLSDEEGAVEEDRVKAAIKELWGDDRCCHAIVSWVEVHASCVPWALNCKPPTPPTPNRKSGTRVPETQSENLQHDRKFWTQIPEIIDTWEQ